MMRVRLAAMAVAAVAVFSVASFLSGHVGGSAEAAKVNYVRVTNANNSGQGSLRAAVANAQASSLPTIVLFATSGPIRLQSDIVYAGSQPLKLQPAQDQYRPVIDGSQMLACDTALLVVTNGADVSVKGVTFQNACGGLVVYAGSRSSGNIAVGLQSVTMRDLRFVGLGVYDLASTPSEAGFDIEVVLSKFEGASSACAPADGHGGGLDIHEDGAGSVKLVVDYARVKGNVCDGLALTENGSGDLQFKIGNSSFTENGDDTFETTGIGVLEQGAGDLKGTLESTTVQDNHGAGVNVRESDGGKLIGVATRVKSIHNVVSSPQPYPQQALGFTWGEDGDGTTDMTLTDVTVSDNAFGVDLFEFGADGDRGGLTARLTRVTSTRNTERGVFLSQDGPGALQFSISASTFNANGNERPFNGGFVAYEYGDGDVRGTVTNTTARDNRGVGFEVNAGGDGNLVATASNVTSVNNVVASPQARPDAAFGFLWVEHDDGAASATMTDITVTDCAEGMAVVELGDDGQEGGLTARLTRITAARNGGIGLRVDQDGPGDLDVTATGISVTGQTGASPAPIGGPDAAGSFRETGDGNLRASITKSHFDGNATDGLKIEETGDGTFVASVSYSTAKSNTDDGIEASAVGAPGTLTLRSVTATGNLDNDLEFNNVTQN